MAQAFGVPAFPMTRTSTDLQQGGGYQWDKCREDGEGPKGDFSKSHGTSYTCKSYSLGESIALQGTTT